jgi:hypothetical protein
VSCVDLGDGRVADGRDHRDSRLDAALAHRLKKIQLDDAIDRHVLGNRRQETVTVGGPHRW